MVEALKDHTYARLFAAQVIALLGTGLLTVALGLLAYDIAGGQAGAVLGTALTIKMVAYVFVAPLIAAATERVDRKQLLVASDLVRAAVVFALPAVSEAWHIYLLVFGLQCASATFTPAFQALIPQVLPDERVYTQALSLSRLAYDLETLISPALAAALLTVMSYNNLFLGTVVGFVGSAALVVSTRLPQRLESAASGFWVRVTRGVRVFWASPSLRRLLALNLVVAAAASMVIVNTVVIVRVQLGREESEVAILLACYGVGSMIVALLLPRMLTRLVDESVMIAGAMLLVAGLVATACTLQLSSPDAMWVGFLGSWLLLGAANSLVLTPSGRLLRRESTEKERPAVFSAQFSCSHACFMICYPLAGFAGANLTMTQTAILLAVVALIGTALAVTKR